MAGRAAGDPSARRYCTNVNNDDHGAMDFLGKAKTFVRIVEAGSFSAAARSLGVSLAAISRQMTALERELDANLIARTTRSLRLTEEGRRFHDHAVRLVREADAARASVGRKGAIGGTVVVSTSVTLGVLRIVPAMRTLLDAHPSLEVDLRLEDRTADLVSEGVDLAIRAGLALPDTTALIAHPLATFARFLVAAPSYLRRRGTPKSVAALAGHVAVLGARSSGVWTFDEGGEARTTTINARLRVGTLLGQKAAVVHAEGLTILPDFVVAKELAEGTLVRLLPKATLAPVDAHALQRTDTRGSARLDVLVAHLRRTLPLSRDA
jgi:DNA-binding transcriptional LysR family regulator